MNLFKKGIAVLMLTSVVFGACKGKTAKQLIIQKWKLTEMSGGISEKMPDSVKNKFLGNTTLDFEADGKYILTSMDTTSHTGTYSISDDQKTLTTISDATSKPETNVINEISENRLVFTDGFGTRLVAVKK